MPATHALWAALFVSIEASAAIFVSWRLSGWSVRDGGSTALRLAVALTCGWGQIIGVQLVCGALFVLYPPVILALHALIAVVAWRVLPVAELRRPESISSVGVSALVGFLTFGLVLDGRMSMGIPTDPDDVQYHIANPASWLISHDIWHIPAVNPGFLTNGYPSNGELVTAWAMGPLSGAEWSALPTIGFGATILVAGALLAEEVGGRALAGLVGAAAILLCPIMAIEFGTALTDWISIAALLLAVGFVLHGRRAGGARWYGFAGVAMGMAIGSKDTAVGPVIVLLVVALAIRPNGTRLRSLGVLGAGIVFFGAFWFIRDWIQLGDPLYPETVHVAGRTMFPGGRSPLTAYSTSLLSDVLRGESGPLILWFKSFGAWVGIAALPLVGMFNGLRADPFRVARRVIVLLAVSWFIVYLAEPYTGPKASPQDVLLQIRYGMGAVSLAVVSGCARHAWAMVLAWIGLATDVVILLRGPIGVRQLVAVGLPHHHSGVIATAFVLAVVCGGLALLPWDGAQKVLGDHRVILRIGAVGGFVLGVSALSWLALRHSPAPTRLDRFLSARGQGHGLVMVDFDLDVLGAMGPQLTHPIVSAGGGDGGEQVPLLTVGQLDARLAQTRPDAVLEGGPIEGFLIVWQPPGYRLLYRTDGTRVFVKDSLVSIGS